jgi:hypothetical protein
LRIRGFGDSGRWNWESVETVESVELGNLGIWEWGIHMEGEVRPCCG